MTRWIGVVVLPLAMGCGDGNKPAPAPPCDSACQDGVALRGVREMLKLAYNLTLQGQPVGPQDRTHACPEGGTVHVFGTASSNAVQGSTTVDLTYVFDQCAYLQKDATPEENYSLTLEGTITEQGTLAVQPSSSTAAMFASDALTITGTVHDPPFPFDADGCATTFTQNGNDVSGALCGRTVGFSF